MGNGQSRVPPADDIESQGGNNGSPSLHIGDDLPGERPPSPGLKRRLRALIVALGAIRSNNNNTYRSLAQPTNNNDVSITVPDGGGGGIQSILMLASVLTTGFQVAATTTNSNNHNSGAQDGNGNNNNEVPPNIDPESPGVSAHVSTSVSPANPLALWVVALLTLSLVITTVLYKPPKGVVFSRNKAAYYITLGSIFVAGVVEVFTAMWISRSHDTNRRRFSFGRVVLCVSIMPLVAIIGISGFAFIEG